jgi:hypothetical protein
MDQHEIAGLDAARAEARGALAGAMFEFGVGQPLALTFERHPNHEGMIGARFGAQPHELRDIESRIRRD